MPVNTRSGACTLQQHEHEQGLVETFLASADGRLERTTALLDIALAVHQQAGSFVSLAVVRQLGRLGSCALLTNVLSGAKDWRHVRLLSQAAQQRPRFCLLAAAVVNGLVQVSGPFKLELELRQLAALPGWQ